MPELKVPLGLSSSGKLVGPVEAEKIQTYACPNCGDALVLRKGEVKVAHFAHKSTDTCSQETIVHQTAKLLIKETVAGWKRGSGETPRLIRHCRICNKTIEQLLPDKTEEAKLEQRLPSGYVVDVALTSADQVLAVVEVRVTHAVDDIKTGRLEVPFIEVDGYAIVGEPTKWSPLIDHFRPLICPECKEASVQFQKAALSISHATKIDMPDSYYRYAPVECWRCHRDILVFTWPDQEMFPDRPPSHQPVPRTIKYEYSKMAEARYWVNTCPYCKSIQGDFFLYMEPDGPFFGLHCGHDDDEAFQDDQMRLASYALYRGYLKPPKPN